MTKLARRLPEPPLDLPLDAADAVGLEPVDFRLAGRAIVILDQGNALEFSPHSSAVATPQRLADANAASASDHLDLADRSK
jgi:hypothetical protein